MFSHVYVCEMQKCLRFLCYFLSEMLKLNCEMTAIFLLQSLQDGKQHMFLSFKLDVYLVLIVLSGNHRIGHRAHGSFDGRVVQ